jgi:uncharacterized protein
LVTREQALRVLRDVGCSPNVIRHSLAVERKAVEIAERISKNGHEIDVDFVRIGAILHDIGRAETHSIVHGVVGARILRRNGLGKYAEFAERHVGAGIPEGEAKELGLPERDFMPLTLEERIVTYADKLIVGDEPASFREVRRQFESMLGKDHPAIKRLDALHEEIQRLQGKV